MEGGVQRYEIVVDRSVRVQADRPERAVSDPAPAPAPDLTLSQEHAVYAALAQQIAEREDGVDAADITPSRDQVRELRRTRSKHAAKKPAKKRRRRRKPVSRRRRTGRREGRGSR